MTLIGFVAMAEALPSLAIDSTPTH